MTARTAAYHGRAFAHVRCRDRVEAGVEAGVIVPRTRGGTYDAGMTTPTRAPLRVPFADLWGMRIEHPYSLLVRAGGHAWTCGQCPLAPDASVVGWDPNWVRH